jgi:hypothetical protein
LGDNPAKSMKCLQCGTSLDRISQWRGSSEYCSEDCKKQSQDEFNRLAMNMLMQPRPARTNSRPSATSARTVEGSGGRLTMVTHPVGASSPALTEPPQAHYILDISATLAELQLCHQPAVTPRPASPLIPSSELQTADALLSLERMLRAIRPRQRAARGLLPLSLATAIPAAGEPDVALPPCEPVWPASLGIAFQVDGMDGVPGCTVTETRSTLTEFSAGTSSSSGESPLVGAPSLPAARPVAHRAIPARRGVRELIDAASLLTGTENLLLAPVPSAPRLRIHLPKPVLNPFRPRYAFAPPPAAAVEAEAASAATAAASAPAQARPAEAGKPKENRRDRRGRDSAPAATVLAPAISKAAATPKVSEPAPSPAAPVEAKRVPAAATAASPAEKPVVKTAEIAEPKPETFTAPSFGGSADAETEGFFSRIPGWLRVLVAVAVLGVGVGVWVLPALNRGGSSSKVLPVSAAPSTMGADSWETDSTGDTAGVARHRIVSLYKPARVKRDYILEFTGQIEQRAMGWVFRMKDARNYYCLKLEQSGAGAGAKAQLVKFAVVDGEEQPHRLIHLREPLPAGQPVQIRLDVRGQNFAIQVNGRPVDVWIDNQLPEGTVGFSNETGERAVIRTVKVSY